MGNERDEVLAIWAAMARRTGHPDLRAADVATVLAADLLMSFDAIIDELGPRETKGGWLIDPDFECLAQKVIKAVCSSGTMFPLKLLTPEGRDDVRAIAGTARRSIAFMAASGADYWPLPDLPDPRERALAAFALEAFVGSGGAFLPPRTVDGIH